MKGVRIFCFSVFALMFLTFSSGSVFAQEDGVANIEDIQEGEGDSYMTPDEYFEKHPQEFEDKNSNDGYFEEDWSASEPFNDSVNCFDYYRFQSVALSFDMDGSDVFGPGETARFVGNIINRNDYPIVNGVVFARISRVNEKFNEEGHHIIDEIIAIDDVSLNALENKKISFEWQAPKELVAGKYQVDFFFSVGKKFNLGGLPFTNEVIAGFVRFTINSDDKNYVIFDRSKTKVNNEKYNHIGNWPIVEYGEEVVITQPVINTFPDAEPVKVSYDLYSWDSLNENDLISHTEEIINIPTEGKDLSFTIQKVSKSVYYLKITLNWRNQKTIVNIRILSKGNSPRLNFPAITKFPLKQGDAFTLFSCFHNASNDNTEGEVTVTLFDKENNEIGKIDYKGDISSAMMADKVDLKADKDYDYLKLEAKIINSNNIVVDKYTAVYDKCDFEDCSKVESLPQKPVGNQNSKTNVVLAFFILLTILVIGVVVWKLKIKNGEIETKNEDII